MTKAWRLLVSTDQHARFQSLPLALIEAECPKSPHLGTEVDCRNTARSLGLVSTQHGNPEVDLRDAIAKIAEAHLINRIAEPNTMATINRTLIQLLLSDAYGRGAAYSIQLARPGWFGRGVRQPPRMDADRGAHAGCLVPVVGQHGGVAKRVVQHARFRMATVSPPSAEA